MSNTPLAGRHRTPGRYNPLSELKTVASRAGETGVKASAVLAASGGLVAAFAIPASAAPNAPRAETGTASEAANSQTVDAARFVATASFKPALVAPGARTHASSKTFGVVGVGAVAKPKPKPVEVPERSAPQAREADAPRASRSGERQAPERTSRTRETNRPAADTKPKADTKPSVSQSASGIVGIARSLLGIPYRYGGTTPDGFDCSGFTQYVYAQAGISIPRTASAQQRAATRVSNPQPGDLVFFGYPAHHVGIYTGPDMMIDSGRAGLDTMERHIFSGDISYGRF